MLIHGRLLVTKNGLMLDEVKSLLQKSLRRQEHSLTHKAAKELIIGDKNQLKWQNVVTFMFEDHCLNHVTVFETLFKLYREKDMLGSVELLSQCYTCRHSACLQVVAISDKHRNYDTFWDDSLPETCFKGLITKESSGINCSLLLANIVKKWRERDIDSLVSLFGLVNMVGKVEEKRVTKDGQKLLLDKDLKAPTIYHLVVSVLHQRTEDAYMKRLLKICFRFCSIPQTPQGLIMFTVLSQLIYKSVIVEKPVINTSTHQVKWGQIGKLNVMPAWAVDKHTYRGKFGKASRHLFLKKFKNLDLSEEQLEEFHGERPKTNIKNFFDVGCVCSNDILPDNPIWEEAKAMYLKQKPSLQKSAKMTKLYYNDLREKKSLVMVKQKAGEEPAKKQEKRKRAYAPRDEPARKKSKLIEDYMVRKEIVTAGTSSSKHEERTTKVTKDYNKVGATMPGLKGPLLQLPTGSAKVYTMLDQKTNKVWKGPYKSKEKYTLCVFFHRAMKEVFGDKHTMDFEENGQYVIFPLLKSNDADLSVTQRAFFDCISKREVPEEEGMFVERESLGIVQLHKLAVQTVQRVPMSVWAHFVWRFLLNIGDTGLYNAIATKDLGTIYGIDMEERRKQVKGNDVMNMMFGKLPRKEMVREIERSIVAHAEEFYNEISKKIDFEKLENLFKEYGLENETEKCKKRHGQILKAFDILCKEECGV